MPALIRALVPLLLLAAAAAAQEPTNLLANPSFEEGFDASPQGWSVYGGLTDRKTFTRIDTAHDGASGLLFNDDDPTTELGLTQTVPATGGLVYAATVWVHEHGQERSLGSYLQMRFQPSNEYRQVSLVTRPGAGWRRIRVTGLAPDDTKSVTIYLYSHRDPVPKLILDDVSLISGAELEDVAVIPPPVPPTIERLKDLRLQTALVTGGQPAATIVAPADRYAAEAAKIRDTIQQITGVAPAIVADTERVAMPLTENLILLGNRSTNATIEQLYNRYYTLLDLKYPGPGGSVVRSLHDPFGNGFNVLFAGGSDDAGVAAAAEQLVARLREAGGKQGELSVGWLADIELSDSYTVPEDLKQVQTWEASAGYGSSGYFGWNSISKRMALYYMTGDEFSAREALRLAFPDEATKQELAATDGEMIENKDAPLSDPYHYNAHMMILFWDLIEESPVFTDAERLQVAQAFANQLEHRKNEGIYPLEQPPEGVGSRHGQWSAVSLYCLGRYFQSHYPAPVWAQCVRGAENHFQALNFSAWVAGENDNLYWYTTGIAPIFTYLELTGDRGPVESGSVAELLRGLEALISGVEGHWSVRYGSLGFWHKAADVMQDGRWLWYRDLANQDLDTFRLGQSYWPDDLEPTPPLDLVDHWTIHSLPEPLWFSRRTGFEEDESFFHGSYRSEVGPGGDFILLDGFNGASRNPYHTFAILELRLNGQNVLGGGRGGYMNQVLTKADGLVEPAVPMDAALRYRDVLGNSVVAVAEVPEQSFAPWKRTLLQRVGRFALVVDELTFDTDTENMEITTFWQGNSASWDRDAQAIEMAVTDPPTVIPGWFRVGAYDGVVTGQPMEGERDLINLDAYRIKLLRATELGSWIELKFNVPQPVEGQVYAELLSYVDRAIVSFELDGQPVGETFDHTSPDPELKRVPLGEHELAAGEHTLRVTAAERKNGAQQVYIGLAGVAVRPEGAPEAEDLSLVYEIRSSQPAPTTTAGDMATAIWRGPAKSGERWIDFSLLAPAATANRPPNRCLQLAPNAAALALPEPAVAVVGEWGGNAGDLVLVQPNHIWGHNLTAAAAGDAALVKASAPVDLDWDLTTATAHVVAAETTTLSLAGTWPDLLVDGAPSPGKAADGWTQLALTPGRHVLLKAGGESRRENLQALLEQAESQAKSAAAPAPEIPETPVQPAWTADLGGPVRDQVVVGEGPEQRVYAAVEKNVQVLGADGKSLGTWAADGPIRVLHWWPEANLLLVGCTDEQVIAFTPEGERKWVFTSVMDPAVFRAAKQYWFKTAPGHEGIHGIGTGPFIDGQNQAFIGSACTLEILDMNGQLVKRMPVFWGPGTVLKIIDGPGDTHNLVIGRWPNGGVAAAVINSEKLDPNPRSFHGVPAGHTYVGGWSAQNRRHLFDVDLDGDGTKEIVSEINGTWNRVTSWTLNGDPIANANIGRGPGPGTWTMRDLDVMDLDGDGKQEVIAGISDGLVLVLDHALNRLWSSRLPSPPAVLAAVATPAGPRIVVASDDGTVTRLTPDGKASRLAKVDGRPERISVTTSGGIPAVVIATAAGAVTEIPIAE